MKHLQILVFTIAASFGFAHCKGQTFNINDYNNSSNYLCQGKWCFDTTVGTNWYEKLRGGNSYWVFSEVKFLKNGTCTLKKHQKKMAYKKDMINGHVVYNENLHYEEGDTIIAGDTTIAGTWSLGKDVTEDNTKGDNLAFRTIIIHSAYDFGLRYGPKRDSISFMYLKGGAIGGDANDVVNFPSKPLILCGYAFGLQYDNTEQGKLSAYQRK